MGRSRPIRQAALAATEVRDGWSCPPTAATNVNRAEFTREARTAHPAFCCRYEPPRYPELRAQRLVQGGLPISITRSTASWIGPARSAARRRYHRMVENINGIAAFHEHDAGRAGWRHRPHPILHLP